MTHEEFKDRWGSPQQWPNNDREAEQMQKDIESLRVTTDERENSY